ncbi:MAG: hypothetical protein IKV54_08600 [Clostridia bacterium]|nr:hypothetical protein [Clostridia bacterium]
MKRTLSIILTLILMLPTFVGCGESSFVPEIAFPDTYLPDTTERKEAADFLDITEETDTTEFVSVDPGVTAPSTDKTAGCAEDYVFLPEDDDIAGLALSAYRYEISYEDFLASHEVRNFMSKNLSELLDTEISPVDIDVHIVDKGAMYPMLITLSACDGYDMMINLRLASSSGFIYGTPYKLYGKYEKDCLIQTGRPEYYHLNKKDLNSALAEEVDLTVVNVRYAAISLSETERRITVPLISDTELYAAVLKIENDLTYSIVSLERVAPNTLTVGDFFIKYESFGLRPLDLIDCDYGIPLSPETAVAEIFGTSDLPGETYSVSEFSSSPFVRIRSRGQDGTDVILYLTDDQSGERIDIYNLPEDAPLDGFEWRVGSD